VAAVTTTAGQLEARTYPPSYQIMELTISNRLNAFQSASFQCTLNCKFSTDDEKIQFVSIIACYIDNTFTRYVSRVAAPGFETT
jgi:hypothetical protein